MSLSLAETGAASCCCVVHPAAGCLLVCVDRLWSKTLCSALHLRVMIRVGQNRLYTPCMIVYLMAFLPKKIL